MLLVAFEGAVPLDEAPAAPLVDKVADGVAEVVDRRNLRLRGSRVILARVVRRFVWRTEGVSLARVARGAASVIAGDDACIVDPAEVVVSSVRGVVESAEPVSIRGRSGARHRRESQSAGRKGRR